MLLWYRIWNDNERGASPGALANVLLPHLPRAQIEAIYRAAPGDEIGSGKFESSESSAALVANALGPFLDRPGKQKLSPPASE